MKLLTSGMGATVLAIAVCSLLQACALNCKNYVTYDAMLDRWVGAELEDYERTTDVKALNVMERPRGRLEYAYSTPAVRYDGSKAQCRTWLEADRKTGKIVQWRYDGECYLHGHCAR